MSRSMKTTGNGLKARSTDGANQVPDAATGVVAFGLASKEKSSKDQGVPLARTAPLLDFLYFSREKLRSSMPVGASQATQLATPDAAMTPRVKALVAAVERATERLERCSARCDRALTHQARVDLRNAERDLVSLKDALKFEMARAPSRAVQ